MLLSRVECTTHFQDVYDEIAQHFDHTRFAIWNGVRQFIDNAIRPHSFVLVCSCDDSCKDYITPRTPFVYTMEWPLASFPTNLFDHTVCTRVLHHIDTPRKRLDALRELLRVTRISLVITMCAREQPIPIKWVSLTSANHPNDFLVPWPAHPHQRAFRYFHLFSREEITTMMSQIDAWLTYDLVLERGSWLLKIQSNSQSGQG